jgi:hypothetical protein
VVSQAAQFVFRVVDQLMQEVDVITMGLRLLSDVMNNLTSAYRDQCLKTILRALKLYAPPPPAHRPGTEIGQTAVNTSNAATANPYSSLLAASSQHTTAKGSQKHRKPIELTRYDTQFATVPEKQRYQQISQDYVQYVQVLELDEKMQVITPRTAARRREEAKAAERAKQKKSEDEVLVQRPQIIIQGRARQNHEAIKLAMQEAMEAKHAEANNSTNTAADNDEDFLSSTRPPSANITSEKISTPTVMRSTANSRATTPDRPSSSASSRPPTSSRPSSGMAEHKVKDLNAKSSSSPQKMRASYRVKSRSEEDTNNAEKETKKGWKGSKGVLGRAALERRTADEVSRNTELHLSSIPSTASILKHEKEKYMAKNTINMADFKLPDVLPTDSLEPGSLEQKPIQDTNNSNIIAQQESSSLAIENSEPAGAVDDAKAGTSTAVNSWLPTYQPAKRKKRLILEDLPDVSCEIFRGFEGQMQANVVLIQGYATLLKMLTESPANRELAFKNGALEIAAEVALVCAAIPKVLGYFVEVVNTLFSDALDDFLEQQVKISWFYEYISS